MAEFSDADLILNKDKSVYHLSLKPEHISKNIIVVGDPGRVYRVSKHFDKVEFEMNKREFITHTGYYKSKHITVMSTGMGVDNIEIAMIELDALFNIDLKTRAPKNNLQSFNIIRIGTSGAIQEDLPIGSALVSEYGIGMDNLLHYYLLEQGEFEQDISRQLRSDINLDYNPYVVKCSQTLLQKIGQGLNRGNTVTSPGFYAPQGRRLRIAVKNQKFLDQITYFNHKGFWLTNFEMETSALYAFAKLLGHHALSINAVLGNRAKGTFLKDPYKPIDDIIKLVLDRI